MGKNKITIKQIFRDHYQEFCTKLLDKTGVLVIPGGAL